MSFENKNLYHLLGNDVEDEEPVVAPREIVKKGTSSRKTDEPPAKADPSKAKNNKKRVGGNEGAFKNKNDNKSVSAPSSTPSKHYKNPLDRQSRTGKKDSGKKIAQGWGSKDGEASLEAEVEAEEDAVAALEEGDETVVEDIPKRSLNDYFEELKLKQAELDGKKAIRGANQGNEDKWTAEEKIVKEKEEYFAASVEKKTKTKAQKEKKLLEFDAVFADQTPSTRGGSSSRGPRGSSSRGRGGAPRSRGSAPRGRGGAAPRGKGKPSKVNLDDDKKFPSL